MTLNRAAIIEAIEEGDIFLSPVAPDLEKDERISHNSIDLSLGNNFWIPRPELWSNLANRKREPGAPPFNIDVTKDPKEYWTLLSVPETDAIIIAPGMTILGHTQEFVGPAADNLTARIRAKSSAAGHNIRVGADAMFGDPGYVSRWTLAITNVSETYLSIPIGAVIVQIYFESIQTADTDDEPVKVLYEGHRNVIEGWGPDAMLPKPIKVRRYEPAEKESK